MARTIDQWTEYSNQIAAQGREVGEATKKASKMLRNVSLGSIFNSGMFKALPQAQQDKLRSQVVDTHGYDPSGPTRSDYDSARAEAAAIRARPLSSFSSDPYSAIGGDESVEDRHAGNLERLTKLMEDRGVLDADGYTEDRADKQGVDEFMDLFQGPGEQGRDTPPDWAFEQGAVPKDYDTDPSAGYGNKYYDPGGGGGGGGLPPVGTGGGFGGGPGAPADQVPNVPMPEWGEGTNNKNMYQSQLQNLMAQRSRYYNNTDPNLGGPALGNKPGGPPQPTPLPSGPPGYTDPLTGAPPTNLLTPDQKATAEAEAAALRKSGGGGPAAPTPGGPPQHGGGLMVPGIIGGPQHGGGLLARR